MPIKVFNKKEKEKILKSLNEQFGIEEIPGLVLQRGEGRLFLFQGDFNTGQFFEFEKKLWLERAGVYFGKIEKDGIRLSIEGSQILKDQITKNIFELDEEQAEKWMCGQELLIKVGQKGFIIMKCGEDFLGTGKASEEKIGNYIPKNRRLKSRDVVR
ncbi:MAG: hypothetical protein KJ566_00245 [Nanoarchaeota archaeon]|nr:hypothetical protein [Nanoarchaeota archaeon]